MKNLELLKKLRNITNVGYSECAKALKASKNNIEEAIKWIRLNSKHKIIKKADNLNKEGNVLAAFSGENAYILTLNSETDFVSNTEMFAQLQRNLMKYALEYHPDNLPDFLKININGEQTINDLINEVAAKFKENISLSKLIKLSLQKNEWFWVYNHANKMASSLVVFQGEINEAVADDICMQIVAFKPKYLSIKSVPETVINEEKENIKKELEQTRTNRPTMIIDKIIAGKLSKFYAENCLLEQPFIKLPKLKISEYLEKNGIKIINFSFEEVIK